MEKPNKNPKKAPSINQKKKNNPRFNERTDSDR